MSENKSQEALTPICLIGGAIVKYSLPVLILCAVFLLLAQIGGSARRVEYLDKEKASFYMQMFNLILIIFNISAVVTCIGMILKFFFDTILGQTLTVIGAALYFGTSFFFVVVMDDPAAVSMPILARITDAFKQVGMIAFFPGLGLMARDLVLYIWEQIVGRRNRERVLGGQKITDKKVPGNILAVHCWDTKLCRPSTRDFCEVYKKRKTCWKLKTGCFCDEGGALRQNLANEIARINQGSTTSKIVDKGLSEKLKVARCKKCAIYTEHQQLKYTIAVPIVFILVLFLGYNFYGTLASTINNLAFKVDKLMSYLTSHPGVANYDKNLDGVIITTFVLVWLGITIISYMLKFVEYLIFELKV